MFFDLDGLVRALADAEQEHATYDLLAYLVQRAGGKVVITADEIRAAVAAGQEHPKALLMGKVNGNLVAVLCDRDEVDQVAHSDPDLAHTHRHDDSRN